MKFIQRLSILFFLFYKTIFAPAFTLQELTQDMLSCAIADSDKRRVKPFKDLIAQDMYGDSRLSSLFHAVETNSFKIVEEHNKISLVYGDTEQYSDSLYDVSTLITWYDDLIITLKKRNNLSLVSALSRETKASMENFYNFMRNNDLKDVPADYLPTLLENRSYLKAALKNNDKEKLKNVCGLPVRLEQLLATKK